MLIREHDNMQSKSSGNARKVASPNTQRHYKGLRPFIFELCAMLCRKSPPPSLSEWLYLLNELAPVCCWLGVRVQLRHHVVVVCVEELGHVQGHHSFYSSSHGKVLVIPFQALHSDLSVIHSADPDSQALDLIYLLSLVKRIDVIESKQKGAPSRHVHVACDAE